MSSMPPTYRLDRTPPAPVARPELDEAQQSVVDHSGGPLLVLAGPGTGKTTTLVEAVVARVERDSLSPDQVLVLTFGRRAADELRTRITRRLGRTSAAPASSTFHSFCFGLLRRWQPAELYAAPLRVLSAPEQDVRLRELLSHSRESGLAAWPDSLEQALRTRGFAREVHAVLSRARELGLAPETLVEVGRESARPEWTAAGAFMEEYLAVLDQEAALDYSELVHRAALLAEADDVRRELRSRYAAVYVDEYQDTDPGQVRLLRSIAGDGRDLVVVGDPDQSIYAFRGADVRGILDFPAQFRKADGSPAEVIALATTRRFGDRLLTASRRVAAGIGVSGSIDLATFATFRNPSTAPGPFGAGRVDAFTFTSSGAEIDHVADILRRAHLEDAVPWSEMAVLVRSAVSSIPGLRRALVGAGVPVEVAGDEVPLGKEPAVQPLLVALRAALDLERLPTEAARTLLLSPLGDLDAAQVRRLGRRLRDADRTERRGERLPLSSAQLLRDALVDPILLADHEDDWAAKRALRLARLLARTQSMLARGATAEVALWELWSGTSWPSRLRAAVERGGGPARAAHRDLDAVCALFDVAARAEEKQDHTGALVFLAEVEAQQIPAGTLADAGTRSDAVRLMTAHRSKGLEWQLVVVTGVQEGTWPDLRRRGTLLQADRLGRHGLVEPPSPASMLAEERRLFYVAVTRARNRLVVTAVASPEPDGDQPSRLLSDLGVTITPVTGRPRRPLSLAGIVGELRRVAADPHASPPLRQAAAARLARLAGTVVDGEPIAASADPAVWWGIRPETRSPVPVRPAEQPVALSGSALAALRDCPLRWFLSRAASGEAARSTALGFGSVIHVLAEHLGNGERADPDEMVAQLDTVWGQLQFPAPWIAERERAAAEDAVRRFARWHNARPDRRRVGSEVEFEVETDVAAGERVSLRGKVDRLETDVDGRIVVVDFKTGRTIPSGPQVAADVQLGVYQLATDLGAFCDHSRDARSAGAELVQLRADDAGMPKVQRQEPPAVDAAGRKPVEVALGQAAETIRSEQFVATDNAYCGRCSFARMCPAQRRGGSVLS
jgi:superfamily I DNA/RNA helicase/RecB family exonuclease